ncbi:MAG: PAS domain-containing protein, partial [Candidatus Tectomicrobia bacterium]|nr:PAS domain-containing protein [Candidatus Tectomicrobia bacterium]
MFWKNDQISPKISLTSMTLIVAILTLVIILVFYSYRQIAREQERGMIELSMKGTTLISSLVAGARVGMMGMMWGQEHLQTLLEEAARDPEVLYLAIVNEEGQVIVHSQRKQAGTLLERDEALRQAFEQGRTTTILRQEAGRGKVFEIVSPFQPMAIDQESARRMERMIQMMHRRSSQSFPPSNLAIKVGLSLRKVDQALRDEVIRALGMGMFCFVGGSAVLYMILLAQNYTSVKRTLREMRTYTQHILDSMGDGLISLNTHGEIVTVNPSACQFLSLQENEVKGKHFTELFREDHLDIASLLAFGRKSIAHEVEWATPAGQAISLSLSAAPIQEDDGKIMGAVLLLRDLRELKAMQRRIERTERLASLGRLAAG